MPESRDAPFFAFLLGFYKIMNRLNLVVHRQLRQHERVAFAHSVLHDGIHQPVISAA